MKNIYRLLAAVIAASLLNTSPLEAAPSNETMQAGGDRLVDLQNDDGGWDWPLDDGNPATGSAQNTIGPIAMGLSYAYWQLADPAQLAALQEAGNFLLAKTNTFSPQDGYLAAQLDRIFGGSTYKNHVKIYFYDQLAVGTYDDHGAGTLYSTASYIQMLRTLYSIQIWPPIDNLAAWDLGMGLVGAQAAGADTAEWINGVKAELDELSSAGDYDVIGLAGAVYGLAYVNEDFDPTAGDLAAASSLNDLADILAGYQINGGGFPEQSGDTVESIQTTAYAALALNEVDRTTYLASILGAGTYIDNQQLVSGGWKNSAAEPDENNEVTGEALWGATAALTSILTENYAPEYWNIPGPEWKTWPQTCSGNAVEFSVRAGNQTLDGDFELNHMVGGVYQDTGGQFAIANGTDFDFTLSHDAASGDFTLSLDGGPSTTWHSGRPGETVQNIFLLAMTKSDDFTSTVKNLALNGLPINEDLVSVMKGKPSMRIFGEPFADFNLQGTLNFSWSSGTPIGSVIESRISVVFSDDDSDSDGFGNACDNCPDVANTTQDDTDGDLIGDACDACPYDAENDADGDSICGDVDNCPYDAANDADGDSVCGDVDNCPAVSNPNQADCNGDGIGDACDAVNPAAVEICDGIDNNCNGQVNEGLTFDADADGYTSIGSCGGTADDCNDNNATVHPGAAEICGDGIDQDCVGGDLSCLDVDNDGDGQTENGGDCDDNDPHNFSGNAEICDGSDNNCDTVVDEGCSTEIQLFSSGAYYNTIQGAYDAIAAGGTDTINIQAMEFGESLLLSRNITVTLRGGYDPLFNDPPTGQTIISASGGSALKINNGTVITDNITLK